MRLRRLEKKIERLIKKIERDIKEHTKDREESDDPFDKYYNTGYVAGMTIVKWDLEEILGK